MSDTVTETPNVMVRLKYYPKDGGKGAYSGRRSFYTGTGADDYMKYIEKGIDGNADTATLPSTGKPDYMNYVGNEIKGTGLFGMDGVLSKIQKAEIRKMLRSTDSVVWDMVISFKEGYGDRYMRDTEAARGLLKAHLNRFFKNAGLNPDNMIWFAGLHTNTDNRHVHVSFFERNPVFLRRGKEGKHYHHGKLRQAGINRFKIAIEQYFSETTMQLKADRAELIAAARESVNHDKKLKSMVEALADMLPLTGRLGYESENMKQLRPVIDGITNHIMRSYPPAGMAYLKFTSRLAKRDDEIRESCKRQKIKNVNDFLVEGKAIAELYNRIGNQIIGFALNVKKRKEKDRQSRTNNAPLSKRCIARRDFLRSLIDCLKLRAIVEAECVRDFEEYIKCLEAACPEPEYERQHQSEMEM